MNKELISPVSKQLISVVNILDEYVSIDISLLFLYYRQKCLHPLQLSLESKSTRLANAAMAGLQVDCDAQKL